MAHLMAQLSAPQGTPPAPSLPAPQPPPPPGRAPRWLLLAGAAVIAVPLLVTAFAAPAQDRLQAVSTLLGVLALALMVAALVLPSRVRRLTRALGIDRVLRWHRLLGMAVVVLVVAHIVLAVAESSRGLALLDPFDTTTAARPAMVATAALVALGATHRLARRRGARYRRWQAAHLLLALTAILETALHIGFLHRLTAVPATLAWLLTLAVAVLGLLGYRWLIHPRLARGAYLVYGRRPETATVYTLILVPADPRRRLRPEPGQFVWLRLRRRALGVDEHPFTIASSAATTNRLELTIRREGAFTHALAQLPPGAPVWLDGPHGAYTAAATTATETVTIAGGVGITPAMSMLRTLADTADPRRHHLVLASRPGEDLFTPELDGLTRRLHLRVHQLHGRRLSPPLLASLLPTPRPGIAYYVTGSPALADAAVDALTASGVLPTAITLEQFSHHSPRRPDRSPTPTPTPAPSPSPSPSVLAPPPAGGRR